MSAREMIVESRRKIAIVFVAVLVALALIAVAAQEANAYTVPSGTCGKNGYNLTWELDHGVLTISGTGEMADYDPYDLNNPVHAPYDAYRNDINRVIINEGVTSVGNCAFSGYRNLSEVVFPATSLKIIGDYAFGDANLTKVVIPESVTYLGQDSFRGNMDLNDIEIKANIREILPWTFADCGAENVIIPESVVKIGDAAFYRCHGKLVPDPNNAGEWIRVAPPNITLPSKLEEIGSHVFEYSGIEHIDLPNTLTTIGENAFYNCSDLKEIVIPSSVIYIGNDAFSGCTNMNVVAPEGVVISISGGSVPANYQLSHTSYTYDGTAKTPSITIKDKDGNVVSATNYTVTYENNINAGTATAIIVFRGEYAGSKALKYIINKAANSVMTKGKTVKVSNKKLRKKTQSIKRTKAIALNNAQGTVTYKKVSVGSKKVNKKYGKKITINKNTGKITVKKGLKKGTYKVKIKVNAAGNANYYAATKTVTVKIRVK